MSAAVSVSLRHVVLAAVARRLPRRVAAMVRVKNEEEFLEAAVRSIIDAVDEVMLIDNASTDATPAIVAALQADYPAKITSHVYPYEVARIGAETAELSAASAHSPRLSGEYYNWCLRRCRQPFVLKWDADMLATATVHRALDGWRRSRTAVLLLHGANVHPDRRHLLAARSTDRAALLARQRCARIPAWVTSLTHDHPEPRLYPRWRARYAHAAVFTQSLQSPFLHPRLRASLCAAVDGASYLHLKFCKRAPFANYSDDLGQVIADNLAVGPRLDAEALDLLDRWGLSAASARRA